MIHRLNVYDAVQERLKLVFENFDYVYVSFSGGKDSGVLLNLCVEYMRRNLPGKKLGVLHLDYEAQYSRPRNTWQPGLQKTVTYLKCITAVFLSR